MKTQKIFLKTFLMVIVTIAWPAIAFADNSAGGASNWTLWQLLKAGGWTMVVLGLVSLLALTLIFYNFLTIKMKYIAPVDFTDNLIIKLESHDLQSARMFCEKKKNTISAIALAGINRASKGKAIVREAMQKTLNKEISKHWKSIAFLGDISSVAPLLGLLGTVIGMIQAFNVISVVGADLKPIMLVGGISKALITTASGLVIAIPALGFYSYFRGIMQDIADTVDDYCTDIIKLIEEAAVLVDHSASRLPGATSSFNNDNDIEGEEALFHA